MGGVIFKVVMLWGVNVLLILDVFLPLIIVYLSSFCWITLFDFISQETLVVVG